MVGVPPGFPAFCNASLASLALFLDRDLFRRPSREISSVSRVSQASTGAAVWTRLDENHAGILERSTDSRQSRGTQPLTPFEARYGVLRNTCLPGEFPDPEAQRSACHFALNRFHS